MALRRAGLALVAIVFVAIALAASATASAAPLHGVARSAIGAERAAQADLDDTWQGDDDPHDAVMPHAPVVSGAVSIAIFRTTARHSVRLVSFPRIPARAPPAL